MCHPEVTQTTTFTRRGLLAAVSALSVISLSQWPGQAWAAELDVDGFLKLSQDLVGRDDLSEDLAADMLGAFAATGRASDLASLADGEDNPELANSVVASWYSGVSPNADATEVLAYTDALLWEAMDYTKPLAYCGGELGYWSDAPEA